MLRFLHWQGIAGIGVALVLLIMLTVQKLEAVRWQKESTRFETLYRDAQAAFAVTVSNARTAADAARAADRANATRVAAEQRVINERTAYDFEARLAAARADAANISLGRLHLHTQGTADPGPRGNSPVPGLPAPAEKSAESSGQDRLPVSDALTATEQAIQLDELIKWVRAQAAVDTNAATARSRPAD